MHLPAKAGFARLAVPGLLSALAIPPSLVTAQEAVTASVCTDPDFPAPVLCTRVGLDSLQANFVFVVDQSGSMRPLWTEVRGAFASLVDAVPSSDQVRLILFAGSATEQSWPWGADAATRAAWRRRVEAMLPPSGQKTDLGAALARALEVVRSEPPDRQQFVFLLTDGAHDPQPGSPYDIGGTSAAWRRLATESSSLAEARPIRFFLIRLAEDADPVVLMRNLPDPDPIDAIGPRDLRMWFERLGREFQVEKLRLAIARGRLGPAAVIRDLEDVRASHGRRVNVSLRAVSARPFLGLSVDSATFRWGQASVAVLAVRGFEIPPGDSAQLTGVLVDRSASPIAPPRALDVEIDSVAEIGGRLEPADELGRIGIPVSVIDSVRVDLDYAAGGVIPSRLLYLATLLLLLSLVLVIAQRIKWASHKAQLDGYALIVRSPRSGGEVTTVKLEGREQVILGPNGGPLFRLEARNVKGRTHVRVDDRVGAESVSLTPQRAKLDNLQTNNVIVVKIDGDVVEYRVMKAGR